MGNTCPGPPWRRSRKTPGTDAYGVAWFEQCAMAGPASKPYTPGPEKYPYRTTCVKQLPALEEAGKALESQNRAYMDGALMTDR